MRFFTFFLFILVITISVQAYTIYSFTPESSYSSNIDTLNSNVGTTGYLIENFQDSTFIAGLTVQGSTGFIDRPNGCWNGTQILYGSTDTIFQYSEGTRSFGIGVGDIESDIRLKVNGVDYGLIRSLANYNRTLDDAREVYIRIDANIGEDLITSVTFDAPGSGDWAYFDHVAIDTTQIPEPNTIICLLLINGLVWFLKLKNTK